MAKTYFEGMDEFLEAVDVIERKAPGRLVDELKRESRQVAAAYRRAIKPHEYTGDLRRGIKSQKGATKRGDSWASTVYRTKKAAHFHLYEEGHDVVLRGRDKRQRAAKGQGTAKRQGKIAIKQYPSKGGLSRVAGRATFDSTIRREEPRLTRSREKYVDKIFKELM